MSRMQSLILRINWAAVLNLLNPIRVVAVNVLIGELPLTHSVVLINHNYN